MIKHKQQLVIFQRHINFDEACESARTQALILLGINDNGHSGKYPDISRSESCIFIKFKEYRQTLSMGGTEVVYVFETGFEVEP